MKTMLRSSAIVAVVFGFGGCTNPSPQPVGDQDASQAGSADAGTGLDGATGQDGATGLDAAGGGADGGLDAGGVDASQPVDANGSGPDAGPDDAGPNDAGLETDAALPQTDAGSGNDAGPIVVDCSTYPPAVVLDGNAVVQDALALAQLSTYRCVRGSVTILSTAMTHFNSLNQLEVVTGTLMISENYALTNLDGLAQLRHIGVGLQLLNNAALQSLTLPSLNAVNGASFWIQNNLSLASISLPTVTQLPQLAALGNPVLTTVSIPLLETSGPISFNGNPLLGELEFPLLGRIDHVAHPGGFESVPTTAIVSQSAGLSQIRLPALLYASALTVMNNPRLNQIQIPLLTSGYLEIANNDILPQCTVDVLCAQVDIPSNRCVANDNPCQPNPCGALSCTIMCGIAGDRVCQ